MGNKTSKNYEPVFYNKDAGVIFNRLQADQLVDGSSASSSTSSPQQTAAAAARRAQLQVRVVMLGRGRWAALVGSLHDVQGVTYD